MRYAIVPATFAVVAIAVPWLMARTPEIAFALQRGFALVCHQQAERSFLLLGGSVAVCARCLGIYLGAAVGLLVSIPRRMAWRFLQVAAALNLIDWLAELSGLHGNWMFAALCTWSGFGYRRRHADSSKYLSLNRLHQQRRADQHQTGMNKLQKRIATQTVIDGSAEEDRWSNHNQRKQVVTRHFRDPQACQPIACHSDQRSRAGSIPARSRENAELTSAALLHKLPAEARSCRTRRPVFPRRNRRPAAISDCRYAIRAAGGRPAHMRKTP